jgi:acyl carrier protein
LANTAHIQDVVRKFVLEQLLPGEDAENLLPDTELVSTGVLDSICVLKLITFIEDEFQVAVEPNEADVDHLDTLNRIVSLVAGKMDAKAGR